MNTLVVCAPYVQILLPLATLSCPAPNVVPASADASAPVTSWQGSSGGGEADLLAVVDADGGGVVEGGVLDGGVLDGGDADGVTRDVGAGAVDVAAELVVFTALLDDLQAASKRTGLSKAATAAVLRRISHPSAEAAPAGMRAVGCSD